MTLFIQGLAVPLDIKNVNGWGIPSTETDSVISSLKASQLRVCPGEAHACDINMDPYGRIGHVVDAWRENDGVHARAQITDSVAARKLQEGTWNDYKWSLLADSKTNPKLNNGWAGGVTIKAMTLVKNPAYSQAQYQIAASEEEDSVTIRTFSDFILIASQEGDSIVSDEELKAAHTEIETLKKTTTLQASAIEDLNKEITTLKASVAEKEKSLNIALSDVLSASDELKTISASKDELETKLTEKTTLVASLEKEKAGSVPMDQLETIIAAAIEKHDKELSERNVLAAARETFATVRKEVYGLDTKPDEFTTLSASDFNQLAEDMKNRLSASVSPIRYAADPSEKTGFTVGRPTKEGWRTD